MLAQQQPREQRHQDDLRVSEHGRKPRADLLDRVVPEDQVGREEGALRPGERARSCVRAP